MESEPKSRSKPNIRKSPEEILLLQEQRKVKKALAAASQPQDETPGSTALLERPWLSLYSEDPPSGRGVKLLTWNLLAQCLVRRELFPTSNCLKAGQREPMIHHEIQRLNADILCLQEVDRIEKLGPMLEQAGYIYRYSSGPEKLHGCLIAYKSALFSFDGEKTVFYDDEEVRPEGEGAARLGRSFQTRNIGLILSLRATDDPSKGVVVSTTHLFWHPRYTYERARQAGILAREVARFQRDDAVRCKWPCIMAGDFNFPPDDPGYALLTGSPLLTKHKHRLLPSYVVHKSVDPSQEPLTGTCTTEDDGSESVDPDKVITNARPTRPTDGLLSIEELVSFYSQNCCASSIYETGLRNCANGSGCSSMPPIYGSNGTTTSPEVPGYYEPQYTSYTHHWKSVLDYIFVLGDDSQFQVSGLLSPLDEKSLEPGLPQKGVCGSDHLPLMAQITFTNTI